MRLVSWNVNGFRAALKNGFEDIFRRLDADIVCLQETKMQPGQAVFEPEGYWQCWNSAERKGYSGTAVFARQAPESHTFGLGAAEHGDEGRAITLEYPTFTLVNVYTPNAQDGLRRIDYRLRWEADIRAWLMALDKKKPVIYCGDLNVARSGIELKNPEENQGSAGFSSAERDSMELLLQSGFTDTFRALYPEKPGAYSWWNYRFDARRQNNGWRIDYFIVSDRLMDKVEDSLIYSDVTGSDHCPVALDISL